MKETGIKDINGKMICEGDVIEFDWENEQAGGHRTEKVEYSTKYAGFLPLIEQVCWRMSFYNIKIVEEE